MNAAKSDQANGRILVYIAGSPRSGTTLLDRVLAGSGIMFGGGEMVLAWQYLGRQGAQCPCGNTFDNCPIWSEFLRLHGIPSEAELHAEEETRQYFEGKGALGHLLGFSRTQRDDKLSDYRHLSGHFLDSLEAALPNEQRFIVDSSKSDVDAIWRPAAFKRLLGRDVKVLHLYRDVRGVMQSHYKGSNMKMEEGLKTRGISPFVTAALWLITNVKALGLSILVGRENYRLVSYERFCQSPKEVLAMIARFLNVEEEILTVTCTSENIVAGGHQVYGNRIRYQTSLTLRSDNTWRRELPRVYRVLGAFIMTIWTLITLPLR